MATFRGHPRRGAVVRLDGDPGLGRVGFDRSDDVRSVNGKTPSHHQSEAEQFMALQGLVQWTFAVIALAGRMAGSQLQLRTTPEQRQTGVHE
jgi:hypothetical protein